MTSLTLALCELGSEIKTTDKAYHPSSASLETTAGISLVNNNPI